MSPAGRLEWLQEMVRAKLLHPRQAAFILTDGQAGARNPPSFWEAVVFYGHVP